MLVARTFRGTTAPPSGQRPRRGLSFAHRARQAPVSRTTRPRPSSHELRSGTPSQRGRASGGTRASTTSHHGQLSSSRAHRDSAGDDSHPSRGRARERLPPMALMPLRLRLVRLRDLGSTTGCPGQPRPQSPSSPTTTSGLDLYQDLDFDAPQRPPPQQTCHRPGGKVAFSFSTDAARASRSLKTRGLSFARLERAPSRPSGSAPRRQPTPTW